MKHAPLLALILAELRASSRSWELRLLLLFTVATGAVAVRPSLLSAIGDKWESAWREPPVPDTPEPLCRPGEGEARAVATRGDVPGWFSWYEPLVSESDADILLNFVPVTASEPGRDRQGQTTIEILGQHKDAESNAVASCVRAQIREERRRRLDDLGVTESPLTVAELIFDADDDGASEAPPIPWDGVALLVVMVLGSMTWAYSALPGARKEGWLETLGATCVPPRTQAASYVGVATLWALANGLCFGLGAALSGVWPDVRWFVLPFLSLSLAGLNVAAFISVADMRASAFRSIWIPWVFAGLGGLAWLVEQRYGLGGLVPIGGLLLPWLGGATTTSTVLAAVLSLPTAALATAFSGAQLDGDGALGQRADPTQARRAAGRTGPEAALLVLIALAGLTVGAAPIGGGVTAQLAAGQILFMVLPALAAPALLGLPTRETLRLGAPTRRAWLALPAVLAGTLSAGTLATVLQAKFLPDNPFQMLDYSSDITMISLGLGVLVPTLGAGLSEELLFRGAVLGLLTRRGRGPTAVLLQAIGFALLHVLAFKLLPTGVIGLLLGIYAWRSGSIWTGVAVHALHNGLAILLAPMAMWLFDPGYWPDWGVAAAAGLALLGLAAAWWSGSGESLPNRQSKP